MSDMPETIRERIEGAAPLRLSRDKRYYLAEEWRAGNLIPADEVQHRIDAAVAEAVERCARACDQRAEEWHRRAVAEKEKPVRAVLGNAATEAEQCAAAIRQPTQERKEP